MTEPETQIQGAVLSVQLVKSVVGYPRDQRATTRSLGLRRMRQKVIVQDSPVIRGMLRKIRHLVEVRPAEDMA